MEWWHYSLIASIFIAVFMSPFASAYPDGLERVAEDLGFAGLEESLIESPFPDYSFPGIPGLISTSAAGLLGTLLLFVLLYGIGKLLV